MDLLKKLHKLAVDNLFNEKETEGFINLVESGTSIDAAIDIIEEGTSENKPVKEDVTIDDFCKKMYQEQLKLTNRLHSLIKELGYDAKDVDGGCGIVSFWIACKSIDDKYYFDKFMDYFLNKMFPSKEKGMALALSKPILGLEPYFEQWVKDPIENVIAGYRLGTEILNVIVGDDSAKSSTYGDDEVLAVIEFFAEQYMYLLEKQHSLRKE